jgi:hypothetical protein
MRGSVFVVPSTFTEIHIRAQPHNQHNGQSEGTSQKSWVRKDDHRKITQICPVTEQQVPRNYQSDNSRVPNTYYLMPVTYNVRVWCGELSEVFNHSHLNVSVLLEPFRETCWPFHGKPPRQYTR